MKNRKAHQDAINFNSMKELGPGRSGLLPALPCKGLGKAEALRIQPEKASRVL
jgi:hypothetical protein